MKLAKLHLTVRPSQLEGARGAEHVVIPIGQCHYFFARIPRGRGERDHHRSLSLDAHPAAQAENGVEHGAGRPRQGGAGVQRGRGGRGASAAEKTDAIRLKL